MDVPSDYCAHCGGPKAVRNPSGSCDHLYWPDNLTDEARSANGIPPANIELSRLQARIKELEAEKDAVWTDAADLTEEVASKLRKSRETAPINSEERRTFTACIGALLGAAEHLRARALKDKTDAD